MRNCLYERWFLFIRTEREIVHSTLFSLCARSGFRQELRNARERRLRRRLRCHAIHSSPSPHSSFPVLSLPSCGRRQCRAPGARSPTSVLSGPGFARRLRRADLRARDASPSWATRSTSTTRTRLSSTGSSPRPSTGPTSKCACARRRPSPTNRAPVCRSMRAGPPASRCVCVCACVTQPGVHALRYGCADSVPLRWYGSRGAGQRS